MAETRGAENGDRTPPGQLFLVDAHAHFYPVFDPAAFLDTAAARFDTAAAGRPATGYLLLAEVGGVPVFSSWRDGPLLARGWEIDTTDEASAIIARDDRARRFVVINGQQTVAREGLEVLLFGTDARVADGMSFQATVAAALECAPLVVLPRGFGKWWGRRGAEIRRAVDRYSDRIFLGDTPGWHPQTPGERALFATVRAAGIPVLRGSDPLPFPDHAIAVARAGSVLAGTPNLRRPLTALLGALRSRAEPTEFGAPVPKTGFVREQVRLRLRRHAASGDPPLRPTGV
ncbi:MAG TPA: hypothetical protein VNZ57_00630 [Longimicrobiales bacterium]|nr:hypothetical protein [Longimicrobiales bacterium]